MGSEKIFSQAMTIIIPMLEFGRALIPGNIPLDRKPGISMTKMLKHKKGQWGKEMYTYITHMASSVTNRLFYTQVCSLGSFINVSFPSLVILLLDFVCTVKQ